MVALHFIHRIKTEGNFMCIDGVLVVFLVFLVLILLLPCFARFVDLSLAVRHEESGTIVFMMELPHVKYTV